MMKTVPTILIALTLITTALGFSTASSQERAPGDSSSISASEQELLNFPVRLNFTTDLAKDLPIDVTAVTTGDFMSFTLGPKSNGRYCTIYAEIVRLEGGLIDLQVEFTEETIYFSEGVEQTRQLGFDPLSIRLAPGEATTLFSSGERTFGVNYIPAD